uniref:Secreted protein n=1 Tax=Mesocestoides corti TaxID=53468 RepID=A0A5K3G115_MESCO
MFGAMLLGQLCLLHASTMVSIVHVRLCARLWRFVLVRAVPLDAIPKSKQLQIELQLIFYRPMSFELVIGEFKCVYPSERALQLISLEAKRTLGSSCWCSV